MFRGLLNKLSKAVLQRKKVIPIVIILILMKMIITVVQVHHMSESWKRQAWKHVNICA